MPERDQTLDPLRFQPRPLFRGLDGVGGHLAQHGKYRQQLRLPQGSVRLLNREELLENGFVLVKEERDGLVSPIGTLYVERYDDLQAVRAQLDGRSDELQVVTVRPEGQAWDALAPSEALRVVLRGSLTSTPSSTTTQTASTPVQFCCRSKGEGEKRNFAP